MNNSIGFEFQVSEEEVNEVENQLPQEALEEIARWHLFVSSKSVFSQCKK